MKKKTTTKPASFLKPIKSITAKRNRSVTPLIINAVPSDTSEWKEKCIRLDMRIKNVRERFRETGIRFVAREFGLNVIEAAIAKIEREYQIR